MTLYLIPILYMPPDHLVYECFLSIDESDIELMPPNM